MTFPRKVQVGAAAYTVTVDAQRCQEGEADFGLTRPRHQEILIHPVQAEGQMRDTLLHEVLHAIIADTGLGAYSSSEKPLLSTEEEERVLAVLTPRLLDTLRRNPRLVAYLTAH